MIKNPAMVKLFLQTTLLCYTIYHFSFRESNLPWWRQIELFQLLSSHQHVHLIVPRNKEYYLFDNLDDPSLNVSGIQRLEEVLTWSNAKHQNPQILQWYIKWYYYHMLMIKAHHYRMWHLGYLKIVPSAFEVHETTPGVPKHYVWWESWYFSIRCLLSTPCEMSTIDIWSSYLSKQMRRMEP